MNLSQAYPSKFLTAEDLNGRDATVTISSVDLEEIGQGRDKSSKLVIGMMGKKKLFVVNKTNAKTIEKVLGSSETDDWIGKRITIGPREVEFQGDMVTALRVSLKAPAAAAAAAPTHGPMGKPLNRPATNPQPEPEPSDQDGGGVESSEEEPPF